MTTNTAALIINLDTLDASYTLGDEEYIRKDIIDDLELNIRQVVMDNSKAIRVYNDNHLYDADDSDFHIPLTQHPCFFIHGERGSGKSTLLRGLSHRLTHKGQKTEQNEHEINLSDRGLDKVRILSLAKVDPTEFAEGESFFIYILSRIADKLNSRIHATYLDGEKTLYKDALKNIQDMSHGLKLLHDSRKSLYDSEDPSFFIEDSISKCASSTDLKKKFYELLEKLSRLCHSDAFLITIDDADLNFSKCNEIMETVRKYMITPRVIFVFAGDMKLYSLVCRDAQLENFHEGSLKYDDTRRAHRIELLNILEDQYMMKLFPVRNRVYLSQFGELLQTGSSRQVKIKKGTDEEEMSIYLNRCLEFLYPKTVHHIIKNMLAHQPMRSMLQMLRIWTEKIHLANNPSTSQNQSEALEILSQGLLNAFSSMLINRQVDFTSIHQLNFNELLNAILMHIGELRGNDDSTKLAAAVGLLIDRSISLYLNSEAVRNLTSYKHVFRYIFFVYPHTQIAIKKVLEHPLLTKSRTNNSTPEEIAILDSEYTQKELKKQLSVQSYITINQNGSKFGAWLTAYLAPDVPSGSNYSKRYGNGVVRLMQQYRNSKKTEERKSSKYYVERKSIKQVSSELKKIYEEKGEACEQNHYKFILMFYHSLCVIEREKERQFYLSTYCLLGNIIELLNCIRPDDAIGSKDAIRKVIEITNDMNSIRAYNIMQNNSIEEEENSEAESKDEETEEQSSALEKSESASTNTKSDSNANRPENQGSVFSDIYFAYKKCEQHQEQIINSIYDWAMKFQDISKDVPHSISPIYLDYIWKSFRSKCLRITDNARAVSKDVSNLAKAGTLFIDYVKALIEALQYKQDSQTGLGEHLSKCIEEFPLCDPIRTADSTTYSDLWSIVDTLNIGPMATSTPPNKAS